MSDELTMEDLAKRGEEAITHAGVKGMKWGVRSNLSESFNPGYSKSRSTAIKKARKSVEAQRTKIKGAKTIERRDRLTRDLKEDPNYVTSRLMTRGEEAAGFALSVVGGVGYALLTT